MLKHCRYLEGHIHADMTACVYCAYHDMPMTDDETIKCFPGGWECYEEAGSGVVYEGEKWMEIHEYLNFLDYMQQPEGPLPDGLESRLRGWDGKLPQGVPGNLRFVEGAHMDEPKKEGRPDVKPKEDNSNPWMKKLLP